MASLTFQTVAPTATTNPPYPFVWFPQRQLFAVLPSGEVAVRARAALRRRGLEPRAIRLWQTPSSAARFEARGRGLWAKVVRAAQSMSEERLHMLTYARALREGQVVLEVSVAGHQAAHELARVVQGYGAHTVYHYDYSTWVRF